MTELLTAVAGALVTGIVTYFATARKVRNDLEAEYDRDLRSRRIRVYQKLWQALEPLAVYAPPGPVTYDGAQELAVSLRTWYYETGGLYLSEDSRDCYFPLQTALAELAAQAPGDGTAEIPPEKLKDLKGKGSRLRKSMARDVGTRKRPIIDDEDEEAAEVLKGRGGA